MTGPEFFQTRMGQIYYEHTMPEMVKALNKIATAMEKQQRPELQIAYIFKTDKELATWLVKENIFRYASEDELFALFHTFKEYYNEYLRQKNRGVEGFIRVLDIDIGEVIKMLKKEYK